MKGIFAVLLMVVVESTQSKKPVQVAADSKNETCGRCWSCELERSALGASSELSIGIRADGAGSYALHIIGGLAYAAKLGVKFAGMEDRPNIEHTRPKKGTRKERKAPFLKTHSHSVDRRAVLNFLFGNASQVVSEVDVNYSSVVLDMDKYPALVLKTMDGDDKTMLDSFEKLRAKLQREGGKRFLLPLNDVEPPISMYDYFFSSKFIESLNRGASCAIDKALKHPSSVSLVNTHERSKIVVAAHVRLMKPYVLNSLPSPVLTLISTVQKRYGEETLNQLQS